MIRQQETDDRGQVEDAELLRRYADEKSEQAFAELVRRHLDLVYSVALRQVGGDSHLAQDVAQVVFTSLARKAAALAGRSVLGGWLYRTTQFAAIDAVRTESRRRARETEATLMRELTTNPVADADWEKLRPTLDCAIGELADDDRDAVVLRFFEGKDFAQVGKILNVTDNAARMRVERALDKLHALLVRRGVTSTTAALGLALANQAGVAAPAGMAASVTGAALAGATAGGGTAVAAAAILMSTTKLQIGIAAALVLAGTAGFWVQAGTRAELRDELAAVRQKTQQIAAVRADNEVLTRTAAEVAALRHDDAEFAKLRDEAEAMKKRMQEAAAVKATTKTDPIVRRQVTPRMQGGAEYPIELRQAGIGGEVQIDFLVDATGSVRNAFVAKSTHRGFEASALEAAKQWQFDPAVLNIRGNDRVVVTHLVVPIVFSPDRDKGEPGKPLDLPPPKPPDWF